MLFEFFIILILLILVLNIQNNLKLIILLLVFIAICYPIVYSIVHKIHSFLNKKNKLKKTNNLKYGLRNNDNSYNSNYPNIFFNNSINTNFNKLVNNKHCKDINNIKNNMDFNELLPKDLQELSTVNTNCYNNTSSNSDLDNYYNSITPEIKDGTPINNIFNNIL